MTYLYQIKKENSAAVWHSICLFFQGIQCLGIGVVLSYSIQGCQTVQMTFDQFRTLGSRLDSNLRVSSTDIYGICPRKTSDINIIPDTSEHLKPAERLSEICCIAIFMLT